MSSVEGLDPLDVQDFVMDPDIMVDPVFPDALEDPAVSSNVVFPPVQGGAPAEVPADPPPRVAEVEELDSDEEEARRVFPSNDEDDDDVVEITNVPPRMAPLTPNELVATQIATMNWGQQYAACPVWGSTWKLLSDPGGQWPDDFKLTGALYTYMLFQERICIPLQAQRAFIRYQHDTMAHVGFIRLWKHLQHRFEWADVSDARKFCRVVYNQCDV